MGKLKALKVELKKWNIETFGVVEEALKSCENKIEALDKLELERGLSEIERKDKEEHKKSYLNLVITE